MSTLFYGQVMPSVDETEAEIRTDQPYDQGKPAAEMLTDPDINELKQDLDPNTGMANRQLAGAWYENEKAAPFWKSLNDVAHEHNDIVDSQVSSSGTAAAREAAGEFGHGTIPHSVAIEPSIAISHPYGNDYFAADRQNIQETMSQGNDGTGIQPAMVGRNGALVFAGKQRARQAATAGLYESFLRGS